MGVVERRVCIPYKPRDQFKAFHARTERWAALVAHRRAGKTVAAVNDLIRDALSIKRESPRVAYCAPTYGQAKDVAWEYAKRFAQPIPGVSFNESELRIDFPNGGRLRLYGLENYDRLRGLYFDAIVLDEYADMDPAAFTEVIRPALSDRQGRATFIGTPKGQNAFHDVCRRAEDDPSWFFARMKASETGIVPAHELEAARADMTREQYAQEYECSFEASVIGAYYAEELDEAEREKRIAAVPYDRAVPVRTYWDLGINDATAVWFAQMVGKEIHLIDYEEWRGQALTTTIKDVLAKPYSYHEHVFPHDLDHRELTTGTNRRDVAEGLLGQHRVTVLPPSEPVDGIAAVRVHFNRFWFDRAKTERGVLALKNYRKQWDEKRKTFHDKPYHDWASDGADALRMLGVSYREEIKQSAITITPFGAV